MILGKPSKIKNVSIFFFWGGGLTFLAPTRSSGSYFVCLCVPFVNSELFLHAVSWLSLDSLSAVSQLSLSCLSDVFQLSFSCLSAVSQLFFSCLWGVFQEKILLPLKTFPMCSDNMYCILQVNNNRVTSDSEASNLVTRLVLDKKFLFILRHQDTVIQMGSIP